MATLHTSIPAKAYGSVSNLNTMQFGSKKMLHLLPFGDSSICSMVLCHSNGTMLSELKVSRSVSIHTQQRCFLEAFIVRSGDFVQGGLPEYRKCVEAHPEGTLRPAGGRLYRDPPGCVCQTRGEV